MNVFEWNGLRGRARLLPSLGPSEVAHPQRLGGILALPALVVIAVLAVAGCVRDRSSDLSDDARLTGSMRSDSLSSLEQVESIARRRATTLPADFDARIRVTRAAIATAATRGDVRRSLSNLAASLGDPHFTVVEPDLTCPIQTPTGLHAFANGVGYFRVLALDDGQRIADRLQDATSREECRVGLILDLRGSDGGQLTVAAGIVGFFIDADTRLGEIVDGDTRIDLIARARPPEQRYRGKIAVLVDRNTISAAEVLATSLQRYAGARVFGEPTAGAASPSTVIQLANGDWLQHPVGRFEPGDVAPVKPDEIVTGDAAQKRAMEWAREK
jgi:hypothetical protein